MSALPASAKILWGRAIHATRQDTTEEPFLPWSIDVTDEAFTVKGEIIANADVYTKLLDSGSWLDPTVRSNESTRAMRFPDQDIHFTRVDPTSNTRTMIYSALVPESDKDRGHQWRKLLKTTHSVKISDDGRFGWLDTFRGKPKEIAPVMGFNGVRLDRDGTRGLLIVADMSLAKTSALITKIGYKYHTSHAVKLPKFLFATSSTGSGAGMVDGTVSSPELLSLDDLPSDQPSALPGLEPSPEVLDRPQNERWWSHRDEHGDWQLVQRCTEY